MSGVSIGDHVPPPTDKSERRAYQVNLLPSHLVLIESDFFLDPEGLDPVTTQKAAKKFVGVLYELSLAIADQQDQVDDLSDIKALDDSLKLDKGNSYIYLHKLRQLGAPLRNDEISEAMASKLKNFGFPAEGDAPSKDGEEEPALTFFDKRNKNAPILWEMMYEGDQSNWPPEWQNFWGFRIPITSWRSTTRPETIAVKNKLHIFSALNETLVFAGREVQALVQDKRLSGRQEHHPLTDVLQGRVKQHLLRKKPRSEETWRQSEGKAGWLRCFLDDLVPDETMRQMIAESWKSSALKTIFAHPFPYQVVHFACHCQTDEETKFLDQLDLQVAGEPISLSASLMSGFNKRKKWATYDPGPLVFLNACGTGQAGQDYESPGLPEKWIERQGAVAVIATLCPVPDYFAYAFARKFYDLLIEAIAPSQQKPTTKANKRNAYVAEALLATRRYFMEKYCNPLGLAYVLYAVKGLRVQADF